MSYEDIRKNISNIIGEYHTDDYFMTDQITKVIVEFCRVNKVACLTVPKKNDILQYTFVNKDLNRQTLLFDIKTIMRQHKLKKLMR